MIIWKKGEKLSEESGFGDVFKAIKVVNEEEQKEKFVIKELKKLDEESIERFKREVRYLRTLDHPRIVNCEGFRLKGAPYFYTMRMYNTSLTYVQSKLSKDYARLKVIYGNILEGLEYLHSEGYYHRDLKPGNVLLNSDTDLVLGDLGLCVNPLSERGHRITRTHSGIGTDFYCSPEQLISLKKTDHRTDIYSFGKMLYEAITLEKPYVLDYSKLPPEIQYIVRKCTEEDFTERFNSVKELRVKFTNAMDILLEGANHDWQSIIKKIHESEEKPSTIYSELAEALSQIEDDEEEKHEALMNITGNMYKVLFESYPDLVKKLMQDFTRFINSQSWPFSYTDTVGDKFLEIFSHINNAKIRILLIKSTLILSVSHNRWYVMGLFVNMLYEINNDEDIVYEVYHELSDKKYELDRISRNIIIKSERLHKVHKKLFDTNSG